MRTLSRCLGLMLLVGCGTKEVPDETLRMNPAANGNTTPGRHDQGQDTPGIPAATDLQVAGSGTPTVSWDAEHGTTNVIARWVARRADGTPLGPNDVDVAMAVNDTPLDSESIISADSKALAVNMTYSMVLDATYSMTLHTPPAFEPMKQAAQKSVQAGQALWVDHPGSFQWSVSWFDDYVYRPEKAWTDAALLSIPTPEKGNYTRLYSAVDFGLDGLAQAHAEIQDNPQNVLVVLSDGKDNHSAWTPPATDNLVDRGDNLSYRQLSWPAKSLDDVLARIRSTPNLTVHTLGMGTDVNDAELQAMADAGHGIYARNPKGDDVTGLFERVTQEFTTLQSSGASLPNAPGDYTFSVTVIDRATGSVGKFGFGLHAGDEDARVLP